MLDRHNPRPKNMDAPRLEENKCSLLIAQYETGHVFKKDLTLFLNGQNENEVFQEFYTFQYAKDFALNFLSKNPAFECSIFDNKGEHIATFDKDGERKFKTNA